MSAQSDFKDKLREAATNGYVYKVTESYVKLHRWSPRGYFMNMAGWRIKGIARRVTIRIDKAAAHKQKLDDARARRSSKRSEVYESAAATLNR